MVGVAQVLGVELPVAVDALARVAEDLYRPREEALHHAHAEFAEVLLKRLGPIGECAEHHAIQRLHAQFARRDGAHVEVGGHPAFALQALAKGQPGELAGVGVAPAVIQAHEPLGVAAELTHDHRATVRAAVDEGMQRALFVARHDHRRIADPGRTEVVRPGKLRFQAQVVPCRPAEDALHLELVDLRVVMQAVGDPRVIVARPVELHGRLTSSHSRGYPSRASADRAAWRVPRRRA